MRNRYEVRRTIHNVLIPYADCIAWSDFGPNGNPCFSPNDFSSPLEEEEAAYTLAAVQLEMPRESQTHRTLGQRVSRQTGNRYVTYPWLRDAVSRLLTHSTYEELRAMARVARIVRSSMKAKGLTEIHSISEALS